jgi:hypothetical protein
MPKNLLFLIGAALHKPIDQCRAVENQCCKLLIDNLTVQDHKQQKLPLRCLQFRSMKMTDYINNRHSFHDKARLKDPTKTEDVVLEPVQVEK